MVQGSLLGPVLFILFSNDLPCYVDDCKLVIYADDVQFGHRGEIHKISELQGRVERSFGSAQQWFTANSLKINPTKTDLVLIKSKRRKENSNFSITIGDVKIEPSSSTKMLGMMVASSLTFEDHISAVIRRCYATIGGLSKLSRSLPETVKKMLIETLVFPHLRYLLFDSVGGMWKKSKVKITKSAAPLCANCKGCSSVSSRDAERDMGLVHWLLTSEHAPVSLRERMIFREDVSVRSTRATEAGQMELPRVRTEHARHYFQFRSISSWNAAPAAVREANSSAQCRRLTRKWRLENRLM